MITKLPNSNQKGEYDLKVTDKNGKSFIMTIGGDYDLFWVPENHEECSTFEISKDDDYTFKLFSRLFDSVKRTDDKYRPVLKDDTITFISEDYNESEANVLKIKKQKDSFIIDFVKKENKMAWSCLHIGCVICFCNSGSRVPDVEQIFMQMFNHLAYCSKSIKFENAEDKSKLINSESSENKSK